MTRPFVQGPSTGKGGRYLAVLVGAHIATAGVVFGFLGQAGALVHAVLPETLNVPLANLVVLAAVAGAAFDLMALRRRTFSLGSHRQTPKMLAHDPQRWWIPPLLWGIDTGLVVTTYRVSFCSWLLLLLTLTGIAPAWIGLAYGIGFAIPLWVTVRFIPACRAGSCDTPHWMPQWGAQALGIASMLALAGQLVVSAHV